MAKGKFKQFDVVIDFSDHYYARTVSKNQNLFSNSSSVLSRKIMREWKILENNLPDKIFVRAYENRIDLLRAVIIGTSRTPYHDGLYFFDIQFPDNYPSAPPNVHYKSHGLRINPNLYSCGSVCLSLLNTWKGKGNERWDPCSSTILQVLVSLQGLVLNEKPYYNEPGLRLGSSWYSYNQNVFVLCCKTSLYVLKNPPRNFEGFVADHFKNRGRAILMACRAYRFGLASIGRFHDIGRNFDVLENMGKKSKIFVSQGFKGQIDGIYSEMFLEFRKTGAALEDIVDDLKKIEDEQNGSQKIGPSFGFSQIISKFKVWFGRGDKDDATKGRED